MTLAVELAVSLSVMLAVSLAVSEAVEEGVQVSDWEAVSLAVLEGLCVSVTLAVWLAVSEALQGKKVKDRMNEEGKVEQQERARGEGGVQVMRRGVAQLTCVLPLLRTSLRQSRLVLEKQSACPCCWQSWKHCRRAE